ncbi:hypothetical protein CN391_25925 [Bacillus anthracis]|nr:hypothetical protein CN391_25925 [Bacillus anthracis]
MCVLLDKTLREKYKIYDELGRGGMSIVWLANDQDLDRKVAIKTIRAEFEREHNGPLSAFQSEAKMGAKLLGHPNIVAVLDYGNCIIDEEAVHFIVLEYINGKTVFEFIRDIKDELDNETYYNLALFIAAEIGKGIEYAHKCGVLHRDIKPQNILLSNYGAVKVADFGLAKVIGDQTRFHTVKGYNSPDYAAPEQWKGEKNTKETDIYQLGGTLYHLFTGKKTFEEAAMHSLIRAQLEKEPRVPREINANISEGLSDLILKMLSKKIEDRAELWELNDILFEELVGEYELIIDISSVDEEIREKVYSILECEIDEDELLEEQFVYKFNNFSEILSEAIQLLIAKFSGFQIKKTKKNNRLKIKV